MDLTTVKARLDNNYYSDLASCVADIQQVRTGAQRLAVMMVIVNLLWTLLSKF